MKNYRIENDSENPTVIFPRAEIALAYRSSKWSFFIIYIS